MASEAGEPAASTSAGEGSTAMTSPPAAAVAAATTPAAEQQQQPPPTPETRKATLRVRCRRRFVRMQTMRLWSMQRGLVGSGRLASTDLMRGRVLWVVSVGRVRCTLAGIDSIAANTAPPKNVPTPDSFSY